MDENLFCPACGNTTSFTELGWLGGKYWLRCRFCGMELSVVNEYGQPLKTEEQDDG